MDRFIKECRREWKRLRVPDEIAGEMAAELEADLNEAESEGASAEDVLGTGVFDARSFARSWANERGVIPPLPAKRGPIGKSPFRAAFVACAVIAAIGAGILIASRVAQPEPVKVAPVPVAAARLVFPGCWRGLAAPPDPSVPTCAQWKLKVGASRLVTPIRAEFVKVPRTGLSQLGWALVAIGLIGMVLLMLISWAYRGRGSRMAAHVEPLGDQSNSL